MNPLTWTYEQWINIALWALGLLFISLFVRFLFRKYHKIRTSQKLSGVFSPQVVRKALDFYFPLSYITHAGMERDQAKDLLHYFLSFGLKPQNFEYTYYLILGDPGAGKTSFLINLYYQYHKQLFDRDYQLLCYPCSHPNLAKTLREYGKASKTVLLLDALDEDSLALKHLKKRLDNILLSTTEYAKVIITCRTGFFPKEMEKPKNEEVMHYIGERHSQLCARFYLLPFDAQQSKLAVSYMLDGKRKSLKRKGKLIARQSGHLLQKPLYMHQLPNMLLGDLPYLYRFQVWEEVAKQWVVLTASGLPSEKIREELALDTFLGDLAWAMAKDLYHRTGWYVPQAQFYEMLNKHSVSVTNLQSDLIQLNGYGDVVFSNLSLCAYLLARGVFEGKLDVRLIEAGPLPEIRLFYEEMCWFSYSHSLHINEGEAGYFRTFSDPTKRPLSNLMVEEIQDISRLYLRRYRNLNLKFLRAMKELKGLYLIEGEEGDLEDELAELLPHEDLIVYLQNYEGIQAFQVMPTVYAGTGPQDMFVERFKPFAPLYHFNPELPLALKPAENASQRLITWFDLDLTTLIDQHANLSVISQTPNGETYSVYEMEVATNEWGLFDKLTIYSFQDGTMNLWFKSTFAHAPIEQNLSQAVNKIADLYAEDDNYKGFWTQDDSIQVEEGFWTGRSWAWKISDNYAYPVQIFMKNPEMAEMVIYGIPKA